MKKTILVRVADIIGNPELEKKTGMTRERYQTLVMTHGLEKARNKRYPVEVDHGD